MNTVLEWVGGFKNIFRRSTPPNGWAEGEGRGRTERERESERDR